MKQNHEENYCIAKYHYIINYLFFSDKIEQSFENVKIDLNDDRFLFILKDIIKTTFSEEIYPEKAFLNFEKLLVHLEAYYQDDKLLNILRSIKKRYNEMTKRSGSGIYEIEFKNKINDINKYKNTDFFIWDKEQMEQLYAFDCGAMLSFNVSQKDYIEKVFSYYVCNQNYIYFVKKILMDHPKLLLNPKIKQRILDILEFNKVLFEEENTEELVFNFSDKNCNSNLEVVKDNFASYFYKFLDFKNESNDLLIRIKNITKKNYLMNFDIRTLINDFYFTFIEKQFVERSEVKNSTFLLRYIYLYINCILANCIDENNKNTIIDMMRVCRDGLDKDELEPYNSNLQCLNLSEETETGFINYVAIQKLSIFELLSFITDNSIQKKEAKKSELMHSLITDHEVIKSFMSTDTEFEDIYLKQLAASNNFELTIRKLILTSPSFFTENKIYNRTMRIFKEMATNKKKIKLKKIIANIKMKKKVKRIYYGK